MLSTRAVGEHDFETQHVIGGDAVGERVRAARILAHVSADGAGALAGWIGGVEIAVGFHGQGDIQVHQAGLDHGALIGEVDFENPVHAREGDHEAAFAGDGASAQAGSRASANDRNSASVSQFHQSHNLGGRLRKRHQVGLGSSTLPSYS